MAPRSYPGQAQGAGRAETAEELGDLWAEARDEVAAEIEDKAFGPAAPPALAAPSRKTKAPRPRKPRRATKAQGDTPR